MKKVVLAVILLIGLTAMAQSGASKERGSRLGSKDLTPEQMATLKTKKMALALDLNEAQQTKIMALHLENAKIRKAKMEERKAQKEAADAQKPTSEERYAMSIARLDRQIAHKAKMKNILSDEQYARWQKIQHRRGMHGKGRRGKGKDRHSEKK